MSEAKRLTLHIGAGKTGTSALQAGLWQMRGALAAQGLLYPEAGAVSHAHHLLAACCHPTAWRRHAGELPADRLLAAVDYARRAAAEADAAGCARMLVSSEYLFAVLPPWAHARLVAAFPDWSIDLLAVLREPVDWAVSAWIQSLKSGGALGFGQYVRKRLSGPESPLRYDRVMSAWEGACRPERCDLLRYEDVRGDVLGAVAATLGVDAGGALAPSANLTPDEGGVARLLEINRSEAPVEIKARERTAVLRVGPQGARWSPEPRHAREVWRIAAPSLARLARRRRMAPLYEASRD